MYLKSLNEYNLFHRYVSDNLNVFYFKFGIDFFRKWII